jgi:hypothetical protein
MVAAFSRTEHYSGPRQYQRHWRQTHHPMFVVWWCPYCRWFLKVKNTFDAYIKGASQAIPDLRGARCDTRVAPEQGLHRPRMGSSHMPVGGYEQEGRDDQGKAKGEGGRLKAIVETFGWI